MDGWIWILILLAIVIIFLLKKKNAPSQKNVNKTESAALTEEADENDIKTKQFQYKRKVFLTPVEKNFLQTLKILSNYNLTVIPQVNLATIVQKIGEFRYQNELYRNIDFGVFDSEYNLLLLIELNDQSHNQYQRQKRDLKVQDIVSRAEIKLIKFYTDKSNNPDYVIGRILGELGITK